METESRQLRLLVKDIILKEVSMKREQKHLFDNAWAQIQELIDDPDFGEQCEQGMSDEAKDRATRLLMTLDLDQEGTDDSAFEALVGLIGDAAEDTWYAEGSSGYPAMSRSTHRNAANKWKSLIKNRLRTLVGAEIKGAAERAEIQAFLDEYVAANGYSKDLNDPGELKNSALARKFPQLPRSVVGNIAQYALSHDHHDQQYAKDVLEHAANLLHDLRKRSARVSVTSA